MHAVANKQHNFVTMVLEKMGHGLTRSKTINGESPLSLAVINGDSLMYEVLENYSAPVEQRIGNNITLEQLALHRGHKALAKKIKRQRLTLQKDLQTHLLLAGIKVGKIDGVIGKKTLSAINKVKKSMEGNPSYRDIIEYIAEQLNRKKFASFLVCNQTNQDVAFASSDKDEQNEMIVLGWFGVSKHTCHYSGLNNNSKGAYLRLRNDQSILRQSPKQIVKKACAPKELFLYKINKKCSDKDMKDYYWFDLKSGPKNSHRHIIVWLR